MSRGPVQARDDVGRDLAFPRLMSRGPIEAIHIGSALVTGSIFPRLMTRGPIEAHRGDPRPPEAVVISVDRERPHSLHRLGRSSLTLRVGGPRGYAFPGMMPEPHEHIISEPRNSPYFRSGRSCSSFDFGRTM